MTFEDLPVGRSRGDAITRAYAAQPPTDTMQTVSVEEIALDTAMVRFRWNAVGAGSMRVRWRNGQVAGLHISFGD